ncbi:phosphoethanolamine transferase domain-containing protein [Zhongshania sp.]|jgi:lipid A ethanolaminephosphotransferase|uniref:phosphoethanolamine transferase domain-containing protein n=1 Tax=Zhongshania sp. TaxID=1971902 RepID=UPI0039C60599
MHFRRRLISSAKRKHHVLSEHVVDIPFSGQYWLSSVSVRPAFFTALLFVPSLFSLFMPCKYVAILFISVAAYSGYFSEPYGTVIDVEMIRNMIETDTSETADLITLGSISRVLLPGLLPAITLSVA